MTTLVCELIAYTTFRRRINGNFEVHSIIPSQKVKGCRNGRCASIHRGCVHWHMFRGYLQDYTDNLVKLCILIQGDMKKYSAQEFSLCHISPFVQVCLCLLIENIFQHGYNSFKLSHLVYCYNTTSSCLWSQ